MPSISTKANRFYPSLPEITRDSVTHVNALQQIKDALQTHERRDNNYLKSFIRFEELVELNIIDEQGNFVLSIDDVLSGTNTLLGLTDTDIATQVRGSLFYNDDGTNWKPTNADLIFDPVNDFLQMGTGHSINWIDSSLVTREFLLLVEGVSGGDASFEVGNAAIDTHIHGTAINFFDQYSFPLADGTANQSIVTDGAGQLSFVDISAATIDETQFVHIVGFETILGTKQFNAGLLMNSVLTMQANNPIQWSHSTGDDTFLALTPVVSAGAWPALTAFSYNQNFDYHRDSTVGIVFNDDGTRAYVAHDTGTVSGLLKNEPDYTTGYLPEDDPTPPNVLSKGIDRIREIGWNSDGTAIFAALFGANTIEEIANSGTPYNPDNGDLAVVTDSFAPTPTGPRSIHVQPDGSRLWYVSNTAGRDIYEVNMSTPDDLTTASMGNSYAPAEGDMRAMKFAPDGNKFFTMGFDGVMYEYTVSTQWDITTASYTGNSLDATINQTLGGSPISFDVSPDGTSLAVMYTHGTNSSRNEIGHYTSSGAGFTDVFFVGDPLFKTQIDGLSTTITSIETDIDGTLNVDGATALQDTLGVVGAADFDSTLDVAGISTFLSNIDITGDIIVSGLVDGRDVALDGMNQDTHIADGTIHFTEASIDHANILSIGTNTHTDIDTHIADGTIHFTEASIDHANILNIGTNTHADIDTHIADDITHLIVNRSTSTELDDITDAVNTDASKVQGFVIFNTTLGVLVFAADDTDGGVWTDGTGATRNTPV